MSELSFSSVRAVTLPAVKQILSLAPFVMPLCDRKALDWAFLSRAMVPELCSSWLPRVGAMDLASTVSHCSVPSRQHPEVCINARGFSTVLQCFAVCQSLLQTWCQNEDHKHLPCVPQSCIEKHSLQSWCIFSRSFSLLSHNMLFFVLKQQVSQNSLCCV